MSDQSDLSPQDMRGFIKRFCPAEAHGLIDALFDSKRARLSSRTMALAMTNFGWAMMGMSPGGTEALMDMPATRIGYDALRRGQAHFGLYDNVEERRLIREYNGKLLSPGASGEMNPLAFDDIRRKFDGPRENWPQLVLTSNHAVARTPKDLWTVAHGIGKLAGGNKALVVSACHARENTMLNGAWLLHRVQDLRERAAHGRGGETSAQHLSPAAAQLAHAILALLAERPGDINVAAPSLGPTSTFGDCLHSAITHRGPAIMLRRDALDVAAHIKLVGYSMAGNTVSDAARLLAYELSSPNFAQWHGAHKVPVAGRGVADMLERIGILTLGAGEVPLTAAEKSRGLHRIGILNTHDQVAGHFYTHTQEQYDARADKLITVAGSEHHLGHDPVEALHGDGKALGYLASDKKVGAALAEFFAPKPMQEKGRVA